MHCVPSAKEETYMAKITIKELYYAHASVEPCKAHRQMSLYYKRGIFLLRKIRSFTVKGSNYCRRTIKIFLNTPAKQLKLSNNIEDM